MELRHGVFIGNRKVTRLFYSDKGTIELSIRTIDLNGSNDLCCKQTEKENNEWVKPSVFHIMRGFLIFPRGLLLTPKKLHLMIWLVPETRESHFILSSHLSRKGSFGLNGHSAPGSVFHSNRERFRCQQKT